MTKSRLVADQGLQEAAAQYVWNKVHGKPMREIARATKTLLADGAVLVVSKGMKRAVVLHPTDTGEFKQADVISDAAVHMVVLQSKVRPISHGRITKYVLSDVNTGSLPADMSAPFAWQIHLWKIWRAAKTARGVHFLNAT